MKLINLKPEVRQQKEYVIYPTFQMFLECVNQYLEEGWKVKSVEMDLSIKGAYEVVYVKDMTK